MKKVFDWLNNPLRIRVLFYLALFALIFPLLYHKAYANDLWKALYSGRYLALNLNFPSHSEFTFSPVVEIVMRDSYNWLGNLVFYGLYQIGGISALQIILRFGLVIFTLVIIHSLIRYKVNSLVLMILFFVVAGIFQKVRLRTAIFLIPFMAIFWWLWTRSREKGEWRWLLGFPLLFLFWGNMHGSYLIGFCFMIILFAGDVIDIFLEKEHPGWPWLGRLFLTGLVVFLILTFAKPFPDYQLSRMLIRPFKQNTLSFLTTVREQTPSGGITEEIDNSDSTAGEELTEGREKKTDAKELNYYEKTKRFLQNMFISGSYEKTLSGEFSFPLEHLRTIYVLPSFLIIVITLSAFILNYKAVSIRYFLVWVAASMLGMAFLRTVPLIVMTMVPILFIKYKRGDFKKLDLGDSVHYIALAACFIIAVNLGYLTWNGEVYKAVGTNFHRPGLGKHPRFSDPVVEYARKKYAGQHSFNNYNSGTYLIWKWWPDKKVFIDSKSSAYRVDFLEEYKNTYSPRLIEKYNLGHVILPLNSKLIYFYFVPHPQWEIEVMDESFVLFVKREKAVNRNPEDFIIQSSLELKKLHWREAKNLQEVLSFISKHQNDESKLEKYLSYTQWRWN